ncbi:hypothetical protein NE865_08183 [Phthorimaea operculella]|nr:hypothetical protein NE865_08183 [Phthorimaea operculella]
MAEINLDGEPIFVDVANEPQLPILYSQLLGSDAEGEDSTTQDQAKPSSSSNDLEKPGHSKAENVSQVKQEIEITVTGIRLKNEQLKCPICKRFVCKDEDRMTRHIRKHRGLNPFQCYMCDYSAYNSVVFKEHINMHQGVKPYKCRYCDYRSAYKKQCVKHETRHKSDNPLKCPDCDFIARHHQSLRSHKAKEHKDDGFKKLQCKVCKCHFTNEAHKKYHSKSRKKCKQCPYMTCSKLLYDTHLKQDHGVIKKRKVAKCLFKCRHCPWTSNSKPKILLHLIHHPDQRVDEDVIDVSVLRDCGIMV